jgi:peroxiredoxin
MIKVGQKLPSASFKVWSESGMSEVSTDDIFANQRVILFAVPGAFTPTCTHQHLAGFSRDLPALLERGVNAVACVAVNDAFVMSAWAKAEGVEGKILMLADGNADFTRAVGMILDGSGFGLGNRSQRYSMIVDNGVVKDLYIEENPGACEQSSSDHILGSL